MKGNYLVGLLIALVFLVAGFFIGRKTSGKETIRFIKGKTEIDTVYIPEPFEVETPADPELPKKPDTLYLDSTIFIIEKVDTAQIIAEYIKQKTYSFNVFNNENGVLDVTQKIGYNRLLKFDYTFTPLHKVVTTTKTRTFVPFLTGGYNTNSSVILGGGLYIKNLGLEYNYNARIGAKPILPHEQASYHSIKLNYKFD